jgi:hypothetical protein
MRKQFTRTVVALPLAAVAFAGWLSSANAAGRDDAIADREVAGPPAVEVGIWRTRAQAVFDPVERTLIRRLYTVWDPMPARNVDFVWIPRSVSDDRGGKINGVGRLIWRMQGKPAYDRTSILSEYRGAMKDGRAEGLGSYFDVTGLRYDGEWKKGLMEGSGTLRFTGGDEYVGDMRGGKANGIGRYVDITGEIFEGGFAEGQRDGTGTTTLPNGNSYRSSWANGKEAEGSRLLRLAQSSGQLAQEDSGDVRIGISIDKSKAKSDSIGYLFYTASSRGSRLIIQPDNKRLLGMWKGNDEIGLKEEEEGALFYGVFSLTKPQVFPLTLIFEVQNRSAAPISVVGAYLAVESSVSDLEPAIQLNRDLESCKQTPFKPTFKAENFGWGAAEGAAMHFAFTNPAVNARPKSLDVSKNIGNVVRTTIVNLEPELKAAGVNTGALAAKSATGFVCRGKIAPDCFKLIKADGIFGSISSQVGLKDLSMTVSVTGTLDYNWRDGKGVEQKRSSPYVLNVPLGHIKIEAECGEGGDLDQVAEKALQLRLDETGYRVPVSFQRSVPAGRTSQLTVTLQAAKSSEHDFTVKLQLADGREIASRPISLIYYLPSWYTAAH